MLNNTQVTLLVSGSIAAYKSAELVREFTKRGAHVRVAMSRSATEFISPLTLQTLSNNPVRTELFDLHAEQNIGHIELADKADVVVVAPATADVIAKAAHGIADDLISTVLLATKAPIVFAPAMNVNMWENPITQRNVKVLSDLGIRFVEPESGELACGWTGAGRLPENEVIVDWVEHALHTKELIGCRFVVSAGPTKEAIDPIRFVSNRSSGKMGYAISRVARWLGGHVSLVSGPTELSAPPGIAVSQVTSAEEMRAEILRVVSEPGEEGEDTSVQFVFMAAAVSDHRPTHVSQTKLKQDKAENYSIEFEPAVDILAELGARRSELEEKSGKRIVLVGFAAETGDFDSLRDSARKKLELKQVDIIVANFAQDSFGKDTTRVWIFDRNGRQEEIATQDKHAVAEKVIRAALRY